MQTKKIGYFLSVLLLFSGLIYSVGASTTTVSFHGSGVTINLTFPEEAHPAESIWHNATLKANTALTLYNLTLVIKSPVDSTWQETTGWYLLNRQLSENESRIEEMYFQLPSNANGTLQCLIFVNTSQGTDYLSTTFYTTRVSELTFSEMQSLYDEMLANYTTLQADYATLLNDHESLLANYTSLSANYTALLSLYDEMLANYTTLQADYATLLNDHESLLANYTSLSANYTALLSEHNELLAEYNSQVATYQALLNSYNALSGDYNTLDSNYRSQLNKYNALQVDYDLLNSTRYSLQTNYTDLQAVYDELNQTYNDLLTELNDLQQQSTRSENALNTDRILMFIFVVVVACLIAFIIYIKRKKPEPYVVIRKETVAMKPDEKS